MDQSKVWLDEIQSIEERTINSQDILESLLKSHEKLKLTIGDSYDSVNIEAKSLLSALQKSPPDDSREEKARCRLSDYTEAASHVMDVIVEMYEQNKQLCILWEKQKARINQKYKLYLFEVESNEVLFYLFIYYFPFLFL